MNLDEVTGMPALPENQFWRIVPGHWSYQETILVRLMYGKPAEVKSGGSYITTHRQPNTGQVLYQAPLMVPKGYQESSVGNMYHYGEALEQTPENFRMIAQHILDDKPYSFVADDWNSMTVSASTYNSVYKGDYPPRSMK